MPECRTANGPKYMGSQFSKTRSGVSCVPWSEKISSMDNFNVPLVAPFDSFSNDDWAKQKNYCRAIDGNTPWCYTASGDGWGWCKVPTCTSSKYSAFKLINTICLGLTVINHIKFWQSIIALNRPMWTLFGQWHWPAFKNFKSIYFQLANALNLVARSTWGLSTRLKQASHAYHGVLGSATT